MSIEEIVKKYIDAWNQQDVAGLLDLMHAGAAYFDAFWIETCVGPHLAQYFRDAMDEEPFWFVQVGEVIRTESGVVFRYSAHNRARSKIDEPILYGAEVLNIRDDKILTVTDIYCSPVQSDLIEVAELAAKRHGLTSHANSGLGAQKAARIKASLSDSVDKDKVYLDPDITISRLAEIVGCTLDQLCIVIESHFGASFAGFLNARRVEFAKALLASRPDDPDIVQTVATSSGFRSVEEFRKRFAEVVGVAPTTFCSQQKQEKPAPNNPRLN